MHRPRPTALRRSGRSRYRVGLVVLATVVVTACGDGSDGRDRSAPPASGPARLTYPAGLDDAGRAAALDAIRTRVRRFGLDARAEPTAGALTITPRPDPYVLEALARKEPTTIVTVRERRPGPCRGSGAEATMPSRRCYTLGDEIATTTGVQSASVSRQPLDGFGVDVTIDSAAWPAWRDALRPQLGRDLAIVSGDRVLADVRSSVMALQTRIGGQLREQDARRLAAALLVDTPLPAELGVRRPAPQRGARTGEVWTASLAVNVCGRWLPPAPSFVGETGVHSHADGQVYVHSLPRSEVGRRLTLGQFLTKGHWEMSEHRLALWRGVDVRPGDPCGARRDTRMTWTVDGIPQRTRPADATLLPARAFVVVFGSDGQRVGDRRW
jgi:hypothetical protein